MKLGRVSSRIKAIAIAFLLLPGALYAADYLWLRIRVNHPNAGLAFGTVQFYWATPLKNGKEEVYFDQPQTEACVRSLFSHFGYRPCWSSSRETVRVIQ